MFSSITSITSYLFGSYSEEESPESLAETLVAEPNTGDWVLIDSGEKQKKNVQSDDDGTSAGNSAGPSGQSLIENKPEDDNTVHDEYKENDDSFDEDASSISSPSESSSNEYDSENELRSYFASKPAKKVRKPRIIIDDKNGFNAGIMDGSWFVTPPPCFIRHKKSKKRSIPSSPMEDMLIEHPSISVYQANTSSNYNQSTTSSDFNQFVNTNTLPTISINSPTDNKSLTIPTINAPINNTPFNYLIEAFDYFPSLSSISKNIPWPDWHGPTKIKVPVAKFIYKPAPSSRRKSRKNQNRSNKKEKKQKEKENDNSIASIFNTIPETNQPSNVSRELKMLLINSNQHESHEYLQEIDNLQYNLASMQKAINQGSQKFLKKSFLNRQNLVKFRSDRQRFTQRPIKCHSLKMC